MQGHRVDTFASQGSAKGVDIQILDKKGYVAGNEKILPIELVKGNKQELHYLLRLVKNGSLVKSGTIYSIIRFKVDYQ